MEVSVHEGVSITDSFNVHCILLWKKKRQSEFRLKSDPAKDSFSCYFFTSLSCQFRFIIFVYKIISNVKQCCKFIMPLYHVCHATFSMDGQQKCLNNRLQLISLSYNIRFSYCKQATFEKITHLTHQAV